MTLTSIEKAPITIAEIHELVALATKSWAQHKSDWADHVVISRPVAITSLYNSIRAALSDTLPRIEISRLLMALDVRLQETSGFTAAQAARLSAPSHGAVRPYGLICFERWTQETFFCKRRGSDGLSLIEDLVIDALSTIRSRVTSDRY